MSFFFLKNIEYIQESHLYYVEFYFFVNDKSILNICVNDNTKAAHP